MSHFLYAYTKLEDHPDPLFDEFTYGDIGNRGKRLKEKLNEGDFIFFWTNISGRQYITAYYVVIGIADTATIKADPDIMRRYRNPHLTREPGENDVIVFGDPRYSRKLGIPLLFDRSLACQLSLNIKFSPNKTDVQAIGSACRSPRILTDQDLDLLLEAIESLNTGGKFPLEISDWREYEIESVLFQNPHLLGPGYTAKARQYSTRAGKIDLLLERENSLLVVEIKEGLAKRQAVTQVQGYVLAIRDRFPDVEVQGAIVCAHIDPLAKPVADHLDIQVYQYGGMFYVEKV